MSGSDFLYPMLFKPIYKEVMWGGDMMAAALGRELPKTKDPIGEAWDIVDRDGDESVIENGPMAGETIRSLLKSHGKDVVGRRFGGGRFPLLIKIIDAGQRLSLQVHPDEQACELIPGAEPKTEIWYVIAAKKGAKIIAGLNKRCTRISFLDHYASDEIEEFLQVFDSKAGDGYFINAGRVHAIGAGNLLLEIQQNSNTTFRISDWGRVDSSGKPRQLHIEDALKSINFADHTSTKIAGDTNKVGHNRKIPIIQQCPFFNLFDLRLVEDSPECTDHDSFHLITSISNKVTLRCEGHAVEVDPGRTCLIPARLGTYKIEIPKDSETTLIKTTL